MSPELQPEEQAVTRQSRSGWRKTCSGTEGQKRGLNRGKSRLKARESKRGQGITNYLKH